jgi:hypothetical protein
MQEKVHQNAEQRFIGLENVVDACSGQYSSPKITLFALLGDAKRVGLSLSA